MNYLALRPYRRRETCGTEEERRLVGQMERRFASDFEGYWHRFGYEIGGPVVYAYTKWIAEQTDMRENITDIAFLARDGWLLRRAYDRLPHRRRVPVHYVYAPRSLKRACRDETVHERYIAYLASEHFGAGTVATVDTVTMNFSGQRLVASSIPNPVHGFFWIVLAGGAGVPPAGTSSAYQSEDFHTVSCWNLMEFIMTSPEPPIRAMADGRPVYAPTDAEEQQRQQIFRQISRGVLEFVDDAGRDGTFPFYSVRTIVSWVNRFLANPDAMDQMAFLPIRFSEQADHADRILLDPFARPVWRTRLRLYVRRHRKLYRLWQYGKAACRILRISM